MKRHQNMRHALDVFREESSWTCEACPTMLEDGQERFCRSCQSYWESACFDHDFERGIEL